MKKIEQYRHNPPPTGTLDEDADLFNDPFGKIPPELRGALRPALTEFERAARDTANIQRGIREAVAGILSGGKFDGTPPPAPDSDDDKK